MKHIVAIIALFFTFISSAYAANIDQAAPAFTAKDISGAEQSIEKHKGKIIVLEWHNPGCPFVHKHYDSGNMQKLQEYALDKGVVWLSINSGAEGKQGYLTPNEAKEMLVKSGSKQTAYILDPEGKIGHLYSAKTTPHMFVIDESGKLVYSGAIDDKASADPADIATSKNYVKEAIDALQAKKPIATAQAQAYGCSIKYKD